MSFDDIVVLEYKHSGHGIPKIKSEACDCLDLPNFVALDRNHLQIVELGGNVTDRNNKNMSSTGRTGNHTWSYERVPTDNTKARTVELLVSFGITKKKARVPRPTVSPVRT